MLIYTVWSQKKEKRKFISPNKHSKMPTNQAKKPLNKTKAQNPKRKKEKKFQVMEERDYF